MNMQFAPLFFILAVYGQLVCGVHIRRQISPCEDASSIPESCRSLLESSFEAVFVDPSGFVDSYCSDTCAQPLYDYFKECDRVTGFTNATHFDFLCSSNSTGGLCVPALVADLSFTLTCLSLTSGTCDEECRTALTTARDNLGCCVYSFYAVSAGLDAAAGIYALCGLDGPGLCDGGVTGEPLQFFEEPAIDPRCEDLVDSVPENCRNLLFPNIEEEAFFFLDQLCSGDCADHVYQFNRQCDARTGEYNSTVLDLYCARSGNAANERCGDAIFSFFAATLGVNPLAACDVDDDSEGCPVACRNAITQAQTDLGCCLTTILKLESEESGADLLLPFCGVDSVSACVGAFTDEPIVPPPSGGDGDCQSLQEDLPPQCQAYASIDTVVGEAFNNPDQFCTSFCNSECGKAVYKYHLQCDRITGTSNAATVDFVCAQNDGGLTCAGVYSDPSVLGIFTPVCQDISGTFCSDACSSVLQEPSRTWGCCLFTLTAFDDNVTYVEGIVEQCKIPKDQAHVCDGGFSGEPIDAPGVETTCDKLVKAIPDICAQYDLSDEAFFSLIFATPDIFLSGFCKSECARPVYDYLSECYAREGDEETDAAYLDLFCTEDQGGSECVKLLSDSDLNRVFSNECDSLEEDKVCSPECSRSFQELSNEWGCCLYSFNTLETNTTYSDQVWSKCGARNPGLCRGAVSGNVIDTPGTAVTVVSSLVTVIALLMLAFTL